MDKSVEILTAGPAEPSTIPAGYAGPANRTEEILSEVLADVVRADRVSVDSHFFNDLGADSLVMARFCARVRKRTDVPSVSMKDVYRNPTIRGLATALADAAPAPAESPALAPVPPPVEVAPPASTARYVLCGTLQALLFLGYAYLIGLLAAHGYEWISAGSGLLDIYLRAVIVGGLAVVGLCALPIVAKWTLIGRWKPQRMRIWSLAYVRFWVVKTLIRANPLMLLFVGSPLYPLYLRALGAKVGRNVAIFSQNVPVCTDLLSIGDGAVIRKDSFFTGYRAHAGYIETGAVSIGENAFVGEATVIDIDTSLGDEAQLGRSSALHTGQTVPDGQRWHGSPAQPTDVNYQSVEPATCGTLRKAVFSAVQLLKVLAVYAPLAIGGVVLLLAGFPRFATLLGSGTVAFTSWTFYRDILVVSAMLFFGVTFAGLLIVAVVPRLLNLTVKPGKVYRLYGFHYGIHRAITRLTNNKYLTGVFGDSSGIVHYLRWIGYDLSQVEQTGSNFGMEVKHDTPYLTTVGSGTMVADGLSIINTEFSNTSFRVSRTSIGPHNFLGNNIAYPPQGRTGNNCLLATKVMIPIDGPVRENVGLLGSPPFEIPRSVERDSRFDHLKSGDELRRQLAGKNRHNALTAGSHLLVRWLHLFGITLLASAAADLVTSWGAPAAALEAVVALLFSVVYLVSVERVVTAFNPLRPLYCSIYDRRFWRRERFWKVPEIAYFNIFNGTPFKNVIWRLLGVRIGKRVFDDGCYLTERALATIGDDCILNVHSKIQCHSQEDGTFKSDRSTIGAGCTLGVGAFIHYGVTIGDGAVLAPDSFLMKGEEVPPRAWWGGNPAREIREAHTTPRQSRTTGQDTIATREPA